MPLDSHFVRRCQSLHRAAQRRWGQRLLGRKTPLRLAGGTQVTGHHDYSAGDDFRYIDWHIAARHDELLSRRFQGSEDQYVHLILDCSASMRVGQGRKQALGVELAAALAYLALANMDRVTVSAIAENLLAATPAVRGGRRAGELFRTLSALPEGGATNLATSVAAFVTNRPPGMAVLISDFFDPVGYRPAIDALRRRHFQPFLIQVYDPGEAQPTLRGRTTLADIESGARLRRRVLPEDLQNYRRAYAAYIDGLRGYCRRYKIPLARFACEEPWEACVDRLIRAAGA